MVGGSIGDENFRPFLEVTSQLVGYQFDDLDWDTIEWGVDEAERNGEQLRFNWFEYSLGEASVRLAWPGRVEVEADAETERAVAVVIRVMENYRCLKL